MVVQISSPIMLISVVVNLGFILGFYLFLLISCCLWSAWIVIIPSMAN